MRYVLAVSLFLVAASAQAERYTVWDINGTVWARDNATEWEWQISRGFNAHSPDVDGHLAVWISDWSYPRSVVGTALTVGTIWPVATQPEVASDPRVSYMGVPGEWAYFAWRQSGGIWAKQQRGWVPPVAGEPAWEIVPNYAGPYVLEGRILSWDGGSMDLHDFRVPEPATLALLLIGLACLAVYRVTQPRPF